MAKKKEKNEAGEDLQAAGDAKNKSQSEDE